MIRWILLLMLASVFCEKGYAQKAHAEPQAFAMLSSRPLIVELLEVDTRIIQHLEKHSKRHPDAVQDYKKFVELYNENMHMAASKFWVLNKEVIYKTTSQIDSLVHAKNKGFACLYYSEAAEQFVDYATGKSLIIPTLNYSRLEHYNKNVDYSIYLPVSFLTPHDEYIETDLIFGLQFMQRNIEYMVAQNKKLSAASYAKLFGTHCSHLETKTLLLDNKLLNDSIASKEIRDHYKYKFNFASAQTINEAVETASDENAYLVSMPYALPTAGGPGATEQIICMRLIIDSKTGNILSSLGTSVRDHDAKIFLTKDFTACQSCK